MDQVAQLKSKERNELFSEVAAKMGISSIIIEKDFWVCWSIHHLFNSIGSKYPLIFKGGTSLSKVYGAINRFSEDIDLAFHRRSFGFDEEAFKSEGRNKKKHRVEKLKGLCIQHIRDNFKPDLEQVCNVSLGSYKWSIEIDAVDPQTLLFHYPRSLAKSEYGSLDYIQPFVRLELGARSDHEPSSRVEIKPYAAEKYPTYFVNPTTFVTALDGQRTFWEKLTILHMEYHRPSGNSSKPRLSRHYYDSVMLYRNTVGKSAMKKMELLEIVTNHKDNFYPCGWARYDLARLGTLKLVPGEDLTKWLRNDYKDMQEMIFDDAPKFDELITELKEMEAEINS